MESNINNIVISKEILEKSREGDEEALGNLIRTTYPLIYRYFYYRISSKEDAQDLTSEVFLRVVHSLKTQNKEFLPWLFRIVKNLLIDYYRKKGREHSKQVNYEDIKNTLGKKDKTNRLFTLDELKTAMQSLTEEQKEVVILKFIEGYNNEEISSLTGKSVGAIKSLQFRALATLKNILKKELL